jgi:hypothetical protein
MFARLVRSQSRYRTRITLVPLCPTSQNAGYRRDIETGILRFETRPR